MANDVVPPPGSAGLGWLWDIEGISEELDLEALHLDLESRSLGIVVNNLNDYWAAEAKRWRVDLTDATDINFVQLSRWLDGRPMSIDMSELIRGMYSLVGPSMTLHVRASGHEAALASGSDTPVSREAVIPDWNGGWAASTWDPDGPDFRWMTLRRVDFDLATRTLDVAVRHRVSTPEHDEEITFSIGPVTSLVISGRHAAGDNDGLLFVNGAYVDGSTYYLMHPRVMVTAVVDGGGASATD